MTAAQRRWARRPRRGTTGIVYRDGPGGYRPWEHRLRDGKALREIKGGELKWLRRVGVVRLDTGTP